jgi:DNA-binding NarL/FixJ family response regulator
MKTDVLQVAAVQGGRLSPARVVLVDDHDLIRAGLTAALTAEPDIKVCGEAADGASGAEVALNKRPDVVLMDIQMPGIGGIAATEKIVARWPQARVVVLTAFSDVRLVRDALAAGAWGYVLKDADPTTVVTAVRMAMRGERPMTRAIADMLDAG